MDKMDKLGSVLREAQCQRVGARAATLVAASATVRSTSPEFRMYNGMASVTETAQQMQINYAEPTRVQLTQYRLLHASNAANDSSRPCQGRCVAFTAYRACPVQCGRYRVTGSIPRAFAIAPVPLLQRRPRVQKHTHQAALLHRRSSVARHPDNGFARSISSSNEHVDRWMRSFIMS